MQQQNQLQNFNRDVLYWNRMIERNETNDGIRMSWNYLPTTKVQADLCVVPVACLFTPLKEFPRGKNCVNYAPIICSKDTCGAVLNPKW